MTASRWMLKLATGVLNTSSESVNGPNAHSRRRTSKPPFAGGVVFALTWIALAVTAAIARPDRFASGRVVSGCCGSQVSAGTLLDVVIASASAQSFAKPMTYFTSPGSPIPGELQERSSVTVRTTRFAFRFADVEATASTSPGHTSLCSSRFQAVYLPFHAAPRFVARSRMADAAFSQSTELRAAGEVIVPIQAAVPGS